MDTMVQCTDNEAPRAAEHRAFYILLLRFNTDLYCVNAVLSGNKIKRN